MPLRDRRARRGARRTLAAVAWLVLLHCLLAVRVLAAEPSASAGAGDPRSAGAGPGLVGDPLLAVGMVALIGLVSLLATLAYVRATGGPRRR